MLTIPAGKIRTLIHAGLTLSCNVEGSHKNRLFVQRKCSTVGSSGKPYQYMDSPA